MSIPKTIHYCWFGNTKKPQLVLDCIATWRQVLPDYQIIEWNETNVDLTPEFVAYAYKKKKWAFVSDYVRLDVLYKHGGVYLDTDMLFLKPIDDFLNYDLFFGAEEGRFISCGIIGSITGHPFIKTCIERYDTMSLKNIEFNKITIPKILTSNFRDFYQFHGNFNDVLKMDGVVVCPKDYFYPYSYEDAETNTDYMSYVKPETYAVHLWHKSWVEYSEFYYLKKRFYYKGFLTAFNNLWCGKETLNKQYLKMLGYSMKQSIKRS